MALWLALYLPQLPLQCIAGASDDERPQVIYQTRGSQQSVVGSNAVAAQAGIDPGMPLTAARSLCTELLAWERDEKREQSALDTLALWAQQFTSKVSPEPPRGLILEIGASLALFGGLKKLRGEIQLGLAELGYSAHSGVAPVPAAAWLLALEGKSREVNTSSELQQALQQLPIQLLPIERERKAALHRLGLQSLGDCLRLPRDSLGQRLGPELRAYLDRALGHVPDPREFRAAPDIFQAQLLLPEPVPQMQQLLFILQRLLRQLGGYLRARDAGAQQMRLGFIMPFAPIEWLELSLLQPSRDPEHLLRLWREKLERHRLSAPTEGLELKVEQLLPLEQLPQDLLGAPNKTDLEFMQTLERLRNRLGARVIRQPVCAADHRPERCGRQRVFPAPQHNDQRPAPLRPLWLLPRPRPLAETGNGGPSLHGPLTLLNGPERIEAGWWDGGDQRRDYYVARSLRQQRLWIYRDLGQPPRWFLHGFFS